MTRRTDGWQRRRRRLLALRVRWASPPPPEPWLPWAGSPQSQCGRASRALGLELAPSGARSTDPTPSCSAARGAPPWGESWVCLCIQPAFSPDGWVWSSPTDAACVDGVRRAVEADPASWGRDCSARDLGLGSSRGLLLRSATQALHEGRLRHESPRPAVACRAWPCPVCPAGRPGQRPTAVPRVPAVSCTAPSCLCPALGCTGRLMGSV